MISHVNSKVNIEFCEMTQQNAWQTWRSQSAPWEGSRLFRYGVQIFKPR